MANTAQSLPYNWSSEQYNKFINDRTNRVARNTVAISNLMKAAIVPTRMRTYHDTYSVSRNRTGEITNQRHSGRCWMFAAFNTIRAQTMELLDVDNFEFSQSYGMFFDKLEKANAWLERIIKLGDCPKDDRHLVDLLNDPVNDGGYYHFAINLIQKWGIVPKDAMPETAASKDSTYMNEQLAHLLRKDAYELRQMMKDGKKDEQLQEKKNKMMEEIWRILAISLGEPPLAFDFEIAVGPHAKVDESKLEIQQGNPVKDEKSDKDDKADKPVRILHEHDITPVEFAERYIPFNIEDYVVLTSLPLTGYPYNHTYHITWTDNIIGGTPMKSLNVPPEILDKAAIASLKAGIPCEMACDVSKQFPRGVEDWGHVLATDTMSYSDLLGIDMEMDRSAMLDMRETTMTHAMTMQGVELDKEGKPVAWRVENSWGKDACKDGYLTVSADWFHTYGGEVVVRREFVPVEVLDVWDNDTPTDVEPWSGFAVALGVGRRD